MLVLCIMPHQERAIVDNTAQTYLDIESFFFFFWNNSGGLEFSGRHSEKSQEREVCWIAEESSTLRFYHLLWLLRQALWPCSQESSTQAPKFILHICVKLVYKTKEIGKKWVIFGSTIQLFSIACGLE